MQVQGLGAIRGPQVSVEAAERAAISLDLDDLYLASEPVEFRAKLVNMREDPGALKAYIEPVGRTGPSIDAEFQKEDDSWELTIDTRPSGLYRVAVQTHNSGPQAPASVHDLFEVAK